MTQQQPFGAYSVAVSIGGLVLAVLVGAALPAGLAIFVLIASQVAALVMAFLSGMGRAAQAGMYASATLLVLGFLVAVAMLAGDEPTPSAPTSADPGTPAGVVDEGGRVYEPMSPDPDGQVTPWKPPAAQSDEPPPGELFPHVPFQKQPAGR